MSKTGKCGEKQQGTDPWWVNVTVVESLCYAVFEFMLS